MSDTQQGDDEWSAKIISVSNGYVIEKNALGEKSKAVYQLNEYVEDDEKENREVVQLMLYELLDFFAEFGSKHDKYRVRVEVEDQTGDNDA